MEDTRAYKEYMRMDVEHFNRLISLVSPLMREAISPAERVALNLCFLATGESFHSLAFQFHILRQAISYMVG